MARQILIAEIHPFNWWIFWLASYFVRVRARVISPACRLFPRGRIDIIVPSDYLTADTATRFKADVLARWQRWTDSAALPRWNAWCGGREVQLAPKLKQELSRCFERDEFLRIVVEAESNSLTVQTVDSAVSQRLRELGAGREHRPPTVRSLCVVNRACDRLWIRALSAAYCVRTLMRLVRGMVAVSTREGVLGQQHFPVVLECDNSNEYYLDRHQRTFTWIVDDEVLSSRDVLFLLNGAASRQVLREAQDRGYAAATMSLLYRHSTRRMLVRAAVAVALVLVRLARPWQRVDTLLVLGCVGRAVEWLPVYERWRPRVYVESVSSQGIETPAIAYLKAMGVRCILYQMSGSYAFGHDGHVANDFRSIFYSHVLASEMVAWNSDQAAFYLSHPQDGLSINVLGPLMPGDESVMQAPPRVIRKRTRLKWDDDGRDHLYVVAFDVGAASWQHRIGRQSFKEFFTYPDCYDAKYNEAFVADIWRLVQTDKRIRLIFKPKREPSAERFMYSANEKSLLQRLEAHPQGFVLAENINPWAPLAIADLCVVLPLTSPGLAAMHYGIPVVYHDPLGVVRAHRQPFLASSMTHSFAELNRRVASALAARGARNDLRNPVYISGPGAAECLGTHPGTNSSDGFRRGLLRLQVAAAVNADKEFVGVTGRA